MKKVSSSAALFMLSLFTWVILYSCSQESNSFVSRTYHNTTARYNAFYLAQERYDIVDEGIWKNQKDDFNQILPYFPDVDTNYAQSLSQDFKYVVEKCKLPINKHKNSNWVDDSYILIGKCKFQEGKFDSAAQVFRYVNTKGPDENAKHTALLWLLRTYLILGEELNADEVYSYLNDVKLSQANKRDFFLTSFEYHRYHGENLPEMLENIEAAIPLIKNNDQRSRANFIAGQIHQRIGHEEDAYKRYKLALKRTPPYELEFHTKLNMSHVSSVEKNSSVAKTNKTFRKMLADLKNEELKDRIYYEMARYHLKRNNITMCLYYLNRSVRENGVNPNQKAYSYLLAGQVYYERADSITDKTIRYTNAKLYYDSTVANMDETFRNYEQITERQQTLTNFVNQLVIIQTQDSLIRMSNMSEDERNTLIAQRMESDKQNIIKERELERKRALKEASTPQQNLVLGSSNFKLYDSQAVSQGINKFQEIWGNRKLEDNWRRINKELSIDDEEDENQIDSTDLDIVDNDTIQEEEIVLNIEDYIKDIPSDDAEKEAALLKIDDAMYRLGKIYNLELFEYQNAIETFDEHLNRFSKSEHRAEILYMQFLLCNSTGHCNSENYKSTELKEYPHSIYAKLMQDPDYIKSNYSANQKARIAYEEAFSLYKKGRYMSARKKTVHTQQTYPNNDIVDHIELLRILTYAKTDDWISYDKFLRNFVQEYKTSELVAYAQSLIDKNKENVAITRQATLNNNDTAYVKNPVDKYYLLATMLHAETTFEKILPRYYDFHNIYYENSSLKTRRVEFSEELFFVTVKDFSDEKTANAYLKRLNQYDDFKKDLDNLNYSYYIISPKNYSILLRTRNLDGYQEFYKAHFK